MTSNQTVRWVAKPALFLGSLVPVAWLVVAALTEHLSPDPLADITNETGVWTLRFLCITLAMTPLRRMTGWNGVIRFRRMLGLFAFFYGSLHLLTYLVADRLASLDFPAGIVAWQTVGALAKATLPDVLKRPFITVGFTSWLLHVASGTHVDGGHDSTAGRASMAVAAPDDLRRGSCRGAPLLVAGEGRRTPPGDVRTCRRTPLYLPSVVVGPLSQSTGDKARRGLNGAGFLLELGIDVVKIASQISLSRPVAYLCSRLAINV